MFDAGGKCATSRLSAPYDAMPEVGLPGVNCRLLQPTQPAGCSCRLLQHPLLAGTYCCCSRWCWFACWSLQPAQLAGNNARLLQPAQPARYHCRQQQPVQLAGALLQAAAGCEGLCSWHCTTAGCTAGRVLQPVKLAGCCGGWLQPPQQAGCCRRQQQPWKLAGSDCRLL